MAATWEDPHDSEDLSKNRRVFRRQQHNLPASVLGNSITWYPEPHPFPGYYLKEPTKDEDTQPVEFLNHSWYELAFLVVNSTWWAAEEDRIKLYDRGTRFWDVDDPQHPDYQAPTLAAHEYREQSDTLEFEDRPTS